MLSARAAAGECDLVVRTVVAGEAARRTCACPTAPSSSTARTSPTITDPDLRASALLPGQEVTYTCVPPGSGTRIGLDRDEDGAFDRDELDEGTDPADAASFPLVPIRIRTTSLTCATTPRPPINPNQSRITFRSAKYGVAPSGVVVPAPGSAADPTTAGAAGGGATLTIYRTDGGTDKVVLPLAAARWKKTGSTSQPGFQYTRLEARRRPDRRRDACATARSPSAATAPACTSSTTRRRAASRCACSSPASSSSAPRSRRRRRRRATTPRRKFIGERNVARTGRPARDVP